MDKVRVLASCVGGSVRCPGHRAVLQLELGGGTESARANSQAGAAVRQAGAEAAATGVRQVHQS